MEHGIGNLADLGNDSRAILVLKLNILHEIQNLKTETCRFFYELTRQHTRTQLKYGVLSSLQNHSRSLSCNLVY